MKKGKKEAWFKDQPDGKCKECIWTQSLEDTLHCEIPQTHLSNPICLLKLSFLETLRHNAMEDYDESEDWKDNYDEEE